MNRQLSVRLPDDLAEGIEARVRRSGKTKSEVVRDALRVAGVRQIRRDPAAFADLMERAAALRATQPPPGRGEDVVTLLRRIREGPALRLPLMRLTVPFPMTDLA
jgi:Arc/MetJ-type ribon-helix-helix transcriptional regulator